AVFWTYGFPLLMAIVLGFAFRPGKLPPVPVGVVASSVAGGDTAAVVAALQREERLQGEVMEHDAADHALARGRGARLVRVEPAGRVLRADPARPEAELARLLVERGLRGGPRDAELASEVEDRPGSRYIDFLIPGLIGLNLLGAGMWGVG